MKIYNTLTNKKETFKPMREGNIGMYVCGPTPYDVAHIGHARSAVSFDVIRRYFIYKGFKVTYVSNMTDIEDKIIKRAAEEKITEAQLVARMLPEYEKDYGALHVLPPDHQPRATEYIKEMVALIEKLLSSQVAYETSDGVYFEVRQCRAYGKLSGQKLSKIQSGARIAVDEKKKHPEDFALWKQGKPGEPVWKGPRGIEGRPGWHIECSAMSSSLLGETIDIHGGGIDLQFPHHECEIAQSEMASGQIFARYWMHNGHVMVNKEKMSKSLGNFFTIKDVTAKYAPEVVRYFLLSTHYRMPIDFAYAQLDAAREGLKRLQDCFRKVKNIAEKSQPGHGPNIFIQGVIARAEKGFIEAMDDDFEVSRALAYIFDFVTEINAEMARDHMSKTEAILVLNYFRKIDTVLAVMESNEGKLDDDVTILIQERNDARAAKNWKRSDEIRALMKTRGIELEDTEDGTVWKRRI